MQTIRIATLLRRVLFADAATCIAMGVLLTLLTTRLSDLLALPTSLLFYAGVSLFPCAGLLLYVATRKKIAALLVWAIVIGNLLWTLDSFLLLLTGWIAPNSFGVLFIIAQAVSVAVLAGLEFIGLQRSEAQPRALLQHS